MSARLFVDWENVCVELRQRGYSVDPVVTLTSLHAAVEESGRIGTVDRVELHLPERAHDRADRVRIEQTFAAPLRFEHCPAGKNMADVAIALAMMYAHYEEGIDGLGAVSQDNDVAYVVKKFGKRRPGRPTAVFVLGETIPYVLKHEPDWAQVLSVVPCTQRQPRPWTDWDIAAWRLLWLGGRYRKSVGEVVLRPPAPGRTLDDLVRAEPKTVTNHMRLVDDAVADLWKLTWGAPFTADLALGHLAATQPTASADALFDALVGAGLVRHGNGGLSVAPSWREGLFVPLRRMVLHLLVAGGNAQGRRLEMSHRRSFIQHPNPSPAEKAVASGVGHDSWQRTRDLALKLGVARPVQGIWHLHPSSFVDEVVDVAKAVVAAVDDDRLRFDVLRQRCCEVGVERGDRWAYVLRAAGLLQVHNGVWSRGGAQLN